MSSRILVRLFLCLVVVTAGAGADRARCRHCHATGSCQHCAGDGKLEACSACNGSGEVRTSSSDLSDPDALHYVSCPQCHGSGEKMCYYCKASGSCRHCTGGVVYSDSPGPQPTTHSSSLKPVVLFNNAYAEHNVTRDGAKGMLIHADFEIYGGKAHPMRLNAYFAFSSGQKLMDTDGQYASKDGQVGATESLRPGFANATYKDTQLFIPYEQLHLKKRIRHDLVFHLEVHSDELGFLHDSSTCSFNVRP